MRSWCEENFESDEAKVVFGTFAAFVGLSPDDAGGGELCHLFASIIQDKGNNVVRGALLTFPMPSQIHRSTWGIHNDKCTCYQDLN